MGVLWRPLKGRGSFSQLKIEVGQIPIFRGEIFRGEVMPMQLSNLHQRGANNGVGEPAAVRRLLIAVALAFLALFLLLPLAAVFVQALDKGWQAYLAALHEPDTLSAIWLTVLTAACCVPVNLFFGIVAAWAIAKFSFPGKSLLIT